MYQPQCFLIRIVSALSSGKTLTIHLRERHGWLLHLNETISTWNLSYPDAVKAVSLSAGQKIGKCITHVTRSFRSYSSRV